MFVNADARRVRVIAFHAEGLYVAAEARLPGNQCQENWPMLAPVRA